MSAYDSGRRGTPVMPETSEGVRGVDVPISYSPLIQAISKCGGRAAYGDITVKAGIHHSKLESAIRRGYVKKVSCECGNSLYAVGDDNAECS